MKLKLKKKDIITLVISLVVIGVAIFFMFKMLGSGTKENTAQSTTQQTQKAEPIITGNIDSDTLADIKKYKDYDEAKLDNIGRVNPFAPLN